MTVANRSRGPLEADKRTTDEAPLLSPGGREFLDGKMDAEEYLEKARDRAAEKVKQDLYKAIVEDHANRRRRIVVTGFGLATIGYLLLGIIAFFSDRSNTAVSIVAVVTAVGGGLITISYGRHDHGGTSDGNQPHGDGLRGFIDHILYRNMAHGIHSEMREK